MRIGLHLLQPFSAIGDGGDGSIEVGLIELLLLESRIKLRNRLMPETINQLMNISMNGPTMFVEENEQMALK